MPPSTHQRYRRLERRDSSGGGYNNLFYILIAILAAFALVSLFNFSRLRRRRRRIINEARRLGLIVPGMDGYIPMRDRQGFVKSDGWKVPQFWEVKRGEDGGERSEPPSGKSGPAGPINGGAVGGTVAALGPGAGVNAANGVEGPEGIGSTSKADVKGEEEWVETTETDTDGREADRIGGQGGQMVDVGQRATLPAPSAETAVGTTATTAVGAPPAEDGTYGARDLLEMPPLDQVTPVSIIPAPEEIVLPAKPLSSIPYFPNFVSYRKEQFEVRPPRFADPESVHTLAGESVDVVFAIRMPGERIECPPGVDEEDLEVVREWGGLELGVTKVVIR